MLLRGLSRCFVACHREERAAAVWEQREAATQLTCEVQGLDSKLKSVPQRRLGNALDG